MDARTLRDIFGQFASGVTVITCRNADGEPHGATVTAFTSVSLEPALCQVTLTRKSKACGFLSDAPFAVNILGADQVDTAMHFAGRPQVPGPVWADGPTAPLLCGAATTLSCTPWGNTTAVTTSSSSARSSTYTRMTTTLFTAQFHNLGSSSSGSGETGRWTTT